MNIKSNENMPTDIVEHSIARQASQLKNEIEPSADLWPNIADKIRELPQQEFHQPKQQTWMPMAMAASLLFAVVSLGFTGYTNYNVQQNSLADLESKQSTIDLIEEPFMLARTGYMTSLATDEIQMSEEVRAVLKKNLKIIDDASLEIRAALINNPNDPFLTDALLLTRQKELQLLNQVSNQSLDSI
jgi:hypothetical protein